MCWDNFDHATTSTLYNKATTTYMCAIELGLMKHNYHTKMHMKSRQKARKDTFCNFDCLIGGRAATILTARQVKRSETY